MDWFLYDIGLRHKRVNCLENQMFLILIWVPVTYQKMIFHDRIPLTLSLFSVKTKITLIKNINEKRAISIYIKKNTIKPQQQCKRFLSSDFLIFATYVKCTII